MKRPAFVLIASLVWSIASAAQADALDACVARVLVALSGYHSAPMESLGALCDDPQDALRQIARAHRGRQAPRLRAIHLLRWTTPDRSLPLLRDLALDRDQSAAVRRMALASLIAARAPTANATEVLRRALADPDPHVRAMAATATPPGPTALSALHAALAVESVGFVREAMQARLAAPDPQAPALDRRGR